MNHGANILITIVSTSCCPQSNGSSGPLHACTVYKGLAHIPVVADCRTELNKLTLWQQGFDVLKSIGFRAVGAFQSHSEMLVPKCIP